MTTEEWKDLPDLQWVATAQAEEWEIEFSDGNKVWRTWDGRTWADVWNFRARPRQPKTKTITMRKALLITFNGKHYAYECDIGLHKRDRFVCWLGEPYTVEVPA